MPEKSGYSCTLTVGVAVAQLTEINLEESMDTHEAGDLLDDYFETCRGLKRWRLTGRANWDGTNAATVSQLDGGAKTPKTVTLANAAGATVFKGDGWISRGTLNLPRGIGTEEIEVIGDGAPSTVL